MMCSNYCEEYKWYKIHLQGGPIAYKINAWVVVFALFIELPWGIWTIITK